MSELTVVDKATEWRRMKSLVLDSVSSPITKRVYNMALDEFFAWYAQEPRPGFTKATVSAWCVTLEERGLGSSSIIVRMSAIRKLAVEATDNGLLAPELAAGIQRVKSAKSIGVRMGNWLSLEAGASASQRSRYHDDQGPTRPCHHRRAARLRLAPVGSGGAHDGACAAAGWPLVHRGFVREARARPRGADPGLGQGGHRCLDRSSRRGRRLRVPARQPRRPSTGRRAVREGCLANAAPIRDGCRSPRHCAPRRTPLLREILPSSRGRP